MALSRYILDELVRVLSRPPRIQTTRAEVRDLTDSFKFLAEVIEPEGAQDANLRDAAPPASVLATLLAAKADYLLTGDKELLAASTPSSRLRNFGHATESDWMLQANQPLG